MRPSSSSAAIAIARISFSVNSLNFFSIVLVLKLFWSLGLPGSPRIPCGGPADLRTKNRTRQQGSHLRRVDFAGVFSGSTFVFSSLPFCLHLSAPTFRLTYEVISTNNLLCAHETTRLPP